MTELNELIAQTKQKKVLYVEDDKDICKNVSDLLKNIFLLVDTALDGQEGLEQYKNGVYDLVITDIKMPRMNGISMIQEIQKINKNQKIIITTAHDEAEYQTKFEVLGISDILQKPITFESLLKLLKDITKE